MKKIFFAISFTLLLSFFSVTVFAQSEEEATETTVYPTPKWVSEKGYWVIESNIHTPKLNIIYFYNNDGVLVYKENVDGIVINLKKRSVKMNLKRVLEQSLIAFKENQKASENEMLVINRIKKQ